MLKIYIARHGQDEDNARGILNGRRDELLTKIGEAQALALGENIKSLDLKFDEVYVSPLKRTIKTAEIISFVAGAPKAVELEDLIERDFGVMSGQPTDSIKEQCSPNIIQAEVITYFLSPTGAETFPDLMVRAKRLLVYLTSRHSDGSILLVTHGDFGKMIYATFYNLPWQQVLTQFHFGNSELLLVSEASPANDSHVFKQAQYNH